MAKAVAVDQEKVQALFDVVQKQKKEISKAEKPNWLTNCSFSYDKGTSNRINIRTVTDVNEIASILAFIIGREKDVVEASKILGIEAEFEWLGFTKEDWVNDLKTRVTQIQLTKRKKELEQYEARLNGLVSQEVRDAMDLAEIMKGLGQ